MSVRQSYAWDLPAADAARRALAATLEGIGCRALRVKAGGDDGGVWIPGGHIPAGAGPQWDAAWLAPFVAAGIEPTPWFYIWPTAADQAGIVAALAHRDAAEIALNPEAEWRVQSNANSFRTLADANLAATLWVHQLRAALPHPVRIAFSSCPTWADFPYEGFAAACDQAEPQQYWPASAFLNAEDEVMAHVRRAGTAKPCVPILSASGQYSDAGVVALARSALLTLPGLAGFSAWEAGNSAFQASAIQQAYALLPVEATSGPAPYGPYNVPLGGGFLTTYRAAPDALARFGWPCTPELTETIAGRELTVQYFERARMEYEHATGLITFGLLGLEEARAKGFLK